MFAIKLLSRLPLRVLYALSTFLAFVVCRIAKYRVRVVSGNLDRCFPNLSAKEKKSLLHKFYKHLVDVVVETVWFGGCSKKRLHNQHLVEMLNPELLNELSTDGHSVVILSSHFANWELTGGILSYYYRDIPFTPSEQNYICVYKKLSSKKWDSFMKRNRIAVLDDPDHYEGYLETNDVLRYVLRHRSEQKFYNFITDQRPYRSAKGVVPVTFAGQQCQSMAAAANLAIRFGFSIVYQRMLRVSRGHYTWEFIPLTADGVEATAEDIMNRYYELLTEDVYAQPEQYLWSHKRFA